MTVAVGTNRDGRPERLWRGVMVIEAAATWGWEGFGCGSRRVQPHAARHAASPWQLHWVAASTAPSYHTRPTSDPKPLPLTPTPPIPRTKTHPSSLSSILNSHLPSLRCRGTSPSARAGKSFGGTLGGTGEVCIRILRRWLSPVCGATQVAGGGGRWRWQDLRALQVVWEGFLEWRDCAWDAP